MRGGVGGGGAGAGAGGSWRAWVGARAREGGGARGKNASDFSFILCLSNASDTLKVQTDYLTFGNLITTSDTPKVQSSEAIAVEEYLLKLGGSIDGPLI